MASRIPLLTTNDMQIEQGTLVGSLNRAYNFTNHGNTFRIDEEDEEQQNQSYLVHILSSTWLPEAISSPSWSFHDTIPIIDTSLLNLSSNITMPVLANTPSRISHYSKEEIENMLLQKIKNHIREFLNLADHEYPFNRVIQWSINE
jgi:hypothetical protein